MTIGAMNPAVPTGTSFVSDGDNELTGIKGDVQGSFSAAFLATPGVTDVIATKTGPQIEDGAEKSADETITGKWSFADRANVENNVAFAGRTTIPGIASFLRINTSNEMEFGEPTSPGVFKNNTMTVEGVWTHEANIQLTNNDFLTGQNTALAHLAILGINAGDTVLLGSTNLPLNIRGNALFNNNIEQPSSNYCLSVTNGSTTISDGSGGTSGWSVTVLTGSTIRINHAIGTAAYIVTLGQTSTTNQAIVFSKGATDFVISFDGGLAIPVDIMVMVP